MHPNNRKDGVLECSNAAYCCTTAALLFRPYRAGKITLPFVKRLATSIGIAVAVAVGVDDCHLFLVGAVGRLLADRGIGLLLGRRQVRAHPCQRLRRHRNGSQRDGLARKQNTIAADLLALARVDVKDVVAALRGLSDRVKDKVLGLLVDLGGGLADDGEAAVERVEGAVAQRIGLLDVRRDVAVGLRQVGKNGLGEGLVGGGANGEALLAVLVVLDGGDAVGDERVLEEVLQNC